MKLDDLCGETLKEVRGCLGCAAVDLETGLPLAMQVVPGSLLTPSAMEAFAVASVDYFTNRTIWQLELEMSGGAAASGPPESFVREIQTATEATYHFMAVVPGWEGTLLILITDKTTNLGMGWVSMRQALERIRELREQERREAPPAVAMHPQPAPFQAPSRPAPADALPGMGGEAADRGGFDRGVDQGVNEVGADGGTQGDDGLSRPVPASAPEHSAPQEADPGSNADQRQPPLRTPDLPNPQWRGGVRRRGPLHRV